MSQSAVGTIFNVQRFSLHDGPAVHPRASSNSAASVSHFV